MGVGLMRPLDQGSNQRRNRKPRVGFYGCALRGGSVVRLRSETNEDKRHLIIVCPACGHKHDVHPYWRAITRYDEGKEPDLIV